MNLNTREKVAFALKDAQGKYLSGRKLSEKLSLSRTAVWKQVEALRKLGYVIEALPRQGYRLISSPDRLLPTEIKYQLKTKVLGRNIYYFPEIHSTNDVAKTLLAQNVPSGTLVVAEQQESGRGRLKRGWFSPLGGIWFSLILQPSFSPAEAPKITLSTAVCITETIRDFLGLKAKVRWPNDVLIEGKKVAGILVEMTSQLERIEYLVVGVGINANLSWRVFSPSLRSTAVSLSEAKGEPIDRTFFLKLLLKNLEEEYEKLEKGKVKRLREKWEQLSYTLGGQVEVTTTEGKTRGQDIGLDDQGALKVRLAHGGIKTFPAGDVQLLR